MRPQFSNSLIGRTRTTRTYIDPTRTKNLKVKISARQIFQPMSIWTLAFRGRAAALTSELSKYINNEGSLKPSFNLEGKKMLFLWQAGFTIAPQLVAVQHHNSVCVRKCNLLPPVYTVLFRLWIWICVVCLCLYLCIKTCCLSAATEPQSAALTSGVERRSTQQHHSLTLPDFDGAPGGLAEVLQICGVTWHPNGIRPCSFFFL